ncbi:MULTISPECIES: CbtB domain-containing protein [Halocynthiibacter]|uniref:CbtB-domain containing protein n=1 Tax=Halocynthiibacter halioticoli TaxID=2986804 RepID=A0AAE3LU89_9RHOB|nr:MULTISPECIES: CbtB domain-containing protein [Halocynthiibacter]MCV6823230.1 CbtB-domain containing protein [Halocynthiibacter halioticoli]MCW4056231.1 CbtB-domain containing protein [Halocynthiibacter sp. SDUM655004]MDE0590803.1 CbtB-domain containing protein [Halocynthiibacter sp. C4]
MKNDLNEPRVVAQAATAPAEKANLAFLPIFAAALAGVMLIGAAGFAQSAVLHDAAHDTRHAVAFPCH